MRDLIPGLAVTYDRATGATRTLLSRDGYLTAGGSTADAWTIAQDFIVAHYEHMGLTAKDLADYEISDEAYSAVTGATHINLRQIYLGLPVYNGQLHINISGDGQIMGVNNTCMPDIAATADSIIPALSAEGAVAAVANHLGIQLNRPPEIISTDLSPTGVTTVRTNDIVRTNIEARLMWLPIRSGEARLVWNFQVATLDDRHVYDFTVDAASGKIWTRFDWVVNDSYRVFPAPLESPSHAPTPPPLDGRQIVIDPADALASPFGWHDTDGIPGAEFTIHRGNNVHAYQDINDTNGGICTSTPRPPTVEADCGGLLDCDFNFPIDFATQDPLTYTSSAVTNLFYWNNLMHDVQYQYGFDEASGNFQENNNGNGGLGGDYVLAEAQDGSTINNANFCTPPDGERPRMQMYLWNQSDPRRDGDFDAGIILHEYGHGISNRLVGGASNVSCLGNAQQPGEGLSDWWALVYTAQLGDLGTDGRGIGTYAFGQPPSGLGIRTQRYSTDPAINTHTYESISGKVIPHGVGEVWAQAAWEVYWALVDQHGFDPNLKNVLGGSGNQRAMLYVNEGLKNTICSPTFVDVRDGIIQAAVTTFGGQDVCLLWEAFAAFGLGVDAVSGGPNSTTPTNGFEVPQTCLGLPIDTTPPTVSVLNPAGGATVSGTLTIDATASDNVGVTRVDFFDDGVLLSSDTTSPYSATWDTTTVADGLHALSASALDAAGNPGTSAPVNVTVQNAAPPTTTTTFSGSLEKGGTNTFNLTIEGAAQVDATLTYDRSRANPVLTVFDPNNNPIATQGGMSPIQISFTATITGVYVFAIDNQSDKRDTDFTLEITRSTGGSDTTPPIASIIGPADGATVSGSIPISATASDNVGVTQVQFFVDGVLLSTDTLAPFNASWATTTGTEGGHSLTAQASDAAGNLGISAAVNVTVDNTDPAVSITGPADGATVSATVTITAEASDSSGVTQVQFLLDGVLLSTDFTAPYSAPWDTTTFNGAHSLTTRATDGQGNVGTSAVVNVSVSNVDA
ncbi:MAG TPA: hypothetical protein EYG51_02245, partial [Pseudomonadales bacterium]|nr:hypothetical protein [Pseudomonadales bacterium]